MKLVAAARLRRAQEAITAARPYSLTLAQVISDLAEHAGRDSHPLLAERENTRTTIITLSSDRGLAGSFNAQVNRQLEVLLAEHKNADSLNLRIVGRKNNDYVKRRYPDLIESFHNAPTSADALDFSKNLSNIVMSDFLEDKTDRVLLVFNEFQSAMTQFIRTVQLLPVVPQKPTEAELEGQEATGQDRVGDFVFEPSKESLLEHLVPLYVQNGLYRASLESVASELGSRMSAMDSATKNAGDMIDRLSLDYNRARQAAITKELLEIISGAEALQG